MDWVQQRAECVRFCVGQAVSPAGQLPVSTDIDYEFNTRNPYNFLQVTYYKVSCSSTVSQGGWDPPSPFIEGIAYLSNYWAFKAKSLSLMYMIETISHIIVRINRTLHFDTILVRD